MRTAERPFSMLRIRTSETKLILWWVQRRLLLIFTDVLDLLALTALLVFRVY